MNSTMNTTRHFIDDNEKIMYIIEKVLNARTPETGVTMEQIIAKGLELGLAMDYPRNLVGDHPWFPRMTIMMGVSKAGNIAEHEEPYLHRQRMRRNSKVLAYHYWVDKSHRHAILDKDDSPSMKKEVVYNPSPVPVGMNEMTAEEKFSYYETACPGKYLLVAGRIVSVEWALKHAEKFNELYK